MKDKTRRRDDFSPNQGQSDDIFMHPGHFVAHWKGMRGVEGGTCTWPRTPIICKSGWWFTREVTGSLLSALPFSRPPRALVLLDAAGVAASPCKLAPNHGVMFQTWEGMTYVHSFWSLATIDCETLLKAIPPQGPREWNHLHFFLL